MVIPLHVLIVEDRPADAELMLHELRRAGFEPDWRRVDTESEYLAALDPVIDVILADYNLPQFDATRALKLAQERGLDIPFVIVTGSISEEVAADAIKRGATDYLLKDRLSRLGPAVVTALEQRRLREEKRRAEQALSESEKRFRALVERSSDAIVLADAEGAILYASPGAARIAGVTPERLIGQSAFYGIHPEDLAQAKEIFDQVLQNPGSSLTGQFRLRRIDGSWRWVEGIETNMLDEPSVRAMVSNYRDITQRKRAEAERQRRVEQMTALNDVALTIQRHLDLDEIYRVACEELKRFGALAGIYLVTEEGWLRHVYTAMNEQLLADYVQHFAGPVDFALPISALPDERVPGGVHVLSAEALQEILQKASLEEHPLVVWLLPHMRNARMLIAPLTREDQAIGVFTVVGEALGEIDAPAVALFARQMSVALENAHLFTAERERRAELDALLALSTELREAQGADQVLARALYQAMQILHAEAGSIVLRQPDSQRLKFVAAEGYLAPNRGHVIDQETSIGGIVLRTRQTYVTTDYASDPNRLAFDHADEIGPAIFVPLQSEVESLGILAVARHRMPDAEPFSPSQAHLLTTIGEMAGNALRRARLYDDAQRRLEQTQALHAIDMVITSSLDMRLTLNVFLDQVTARLRVDAADILVRNASLQTLEYAAGRGFRSSALSHTRLRIGEGYAGQAALERRMVSVLDFAKNPNGLSRSPWLAAEGFVSYFAVPLIAKGDVQGVLEIFHRAPVEPDNEWLEFLNTLATQAAIAIDNATLFNDLQRANTELVMAYDATIQGWSQALDLRDRETQGHTERVTEMAERLARAVGISEAEIVHVRRGALLHDIGKMGVPDAVLLKPDKLTDDEWQVMRKHPELAFQMLSPIAYLRPALDIPYCHHEKWDGTGYPRGLRGDQIPLAARAFAVVDVWDALRSDRPYRPAWTEEKALEYVRSQAGTHFDPKVIEVFLQMIESG